MRTENSFRIWLWILFLFLLLLFLGFHFRYIDDDAYISLRYARNLVEGKGLVFNAGERVEGYTNFLWTIILAGAIYCQFDAEKTFFWLGYIFSCLTLLVLFKLGQKKEGESGIIAPTLLASNASYGIWSFAGLENSLFIFLIMMGYFSYERKNRFGKWFLLSSFFFALATLTRPEGLIFYLILLFYGWITSEDKERKCAINFILPFAMILIAHIVFRYFYYGSIIPNTYYVRSSSSFKELMANMLAGLSYIKNYFWGPPLIFILLAIFPFLPGKSDKRGGLFIINILIFYLYLLFVGGDAKIYSRFLTFSFPFLFLLVQNGFRYIFPYNLREAAFVEGMIRVLIVVLLMFISFAPALGIFQNSDYKRMIYLRDNLHQQRYKLGIWLRKNASPSATIATSAIGLVPYLSGLKTFDMLGIIDPNISRYSQRELNLPISHQKSNFDYILAKKPDYLIFCTIIKEEELAKAIKAGYYYISVEGVSFPVMKKK